jgi:hypothetical protein
MQFGQQYAEDRATRATTPSVKPRRYQTNASLSQPPTKAPERPVREYMTNVSWRANRMTPAA